jgi:ABC-2 type transport system permease protein
VPAMPSQGFQWPPVLALTATAAVLTVAGIVGFRRRDAGY